MTYYTGHCLDCELTPISWFIATRHKEELDKWKEQHQGHNVHTERR